MGILWADLILLSFADQQRAMSQETTDLPSLLGMSPLSLLSSPFSVTSVKGRMLDFLVCGVRCLDSSLFWFTAGFYICFMPFRATWVPHMGSSPIMSMRLPWLRCFVKGADFFMVSHYLYHSCAADVAAHESPEEMISQVFFRDRYVAHTWSCGY